MAEPAELAGIVAHIDQVVDRRRQPGPAGRAMTADRSAALDQLTTGGQIGGWWPGVYEAETAAFGGNPGIDIAHDLFCADSHAIITMLRNDETRSAAGNYPYAEDCISGPAYAPHAVAHV